jgi:hypothetical protein
MLLLRRECKQRENKGEGQIVNYCKKWKEKIRFCIPFWKYIYKFASQIKV